MCPRKKASGDIRAMEGMAMAAIGTVASVSRRARIHAVDLLGAIRRATAASATAVAH